MVQNFNGLSSVTKVLEGYFIENIKKCKIQTIEEKALYIKLAHNLHGEISIPGLGKTIENFKAKNLKNMRILMEVLNRCYS